MCTFDRFARSTDHAALLVNRLPAQQQLVDFATINRSCTTDRSRMPSAELLEVALAQHTYTAAPAPQL